MAVVSSSRASRVNLTAFATSLFCKALINSAETWVAL
jgi:hypothetical protein